MLYNDVLHFDLLFFVLILFYQIKFFFFCSYNVKNIKFASPVIYIVNHTNTYSKYIYILYTDCKSYLDWPASVVESQNEKRLFTGSKPLGPCSVRRACKRAPDKLRPSAWQSGTRRDSDRSRLTLQRLRVRESIDVGAICRAYEKSDGTRPGYYTRGDGRHRTRVMDP